MLERQIVERNLRYLVVEIFWAAIFTGCVSFNAAYLIRLGGSNLLVSLLSSGAALVNAVAALPFAAFLERRGVIVEGLNSIPGVKCAMPQGAFYAFPNIEGTGRTSEQLAEDLLQKGGVACLSGTSFGKYGQGYLRLSYANSLPNICKALDRIAEVLNA